MVNVRQTTLVHATVAAAFGRPLSWRYGALHARLLGTLGFLQIGNSIVVVTISDKVLKICSICEPIWSAPVT